MDSPELDFRPSRPKPIPPEAPPELDLEDLQGLLLHGYREMQELALRLTLVLVLAQIALGLLSVVTYLGRATVTAHLAAGALLLASLVALAVGLGPLGARLREPAFVHVSEAPGRVDRC